MKRNILMGLPIFFLSSQLSLAEETATGNKAVVLDTITIKGQGMQEADRAFSVNSISQEQIRAKQSQSPITLIEELPGVNVTSYQQGGVADVFQLRGFTGGGHGSDAGVVLDGISLNEGESHADGYADTNLIIPLELEGVTVYKGPVSPLYGNFARGGVVSFATRKGGEYQDFDFSMGSYGTHNAQGAMGIKLGQVQINGALQGYESDGWRENSRYTKMNAAVRAAYEISERSEVACRCAATAAIGRRRGMFCGINFRTTTAAASKIRRSEPSRTPATNNSPASASISITASVKTCGC